MWLRRGRYNAVFTFFYINKYCSPKNFYLSDFDGFTSFEQDLIVFWKCFSPTKIETSVAWEIKDGICEILNLVAPWQISMSVFDKNCWKCCAVIPGTVVPLRKSNDAKCVHIACKRMLVFFHNYCVNHIC